MRTLLLTLLPVAAVLVSAFPPAAAKPDTWSKSVNGLQARLSFAHKETVNGTPILITYLELRNVSDRGNGMEVPLDQAWTFTVTDAAGKEVAPADGPFDEIRAETGMLRLPFDSSMRINIARRGAGISKDQAAHLDLGPLTHWTFKRGEENSYYLQAKYTVAPAKTEGSQWHGTIEIPKTKVVIPEAAK